LLMSCSPRRGMWGFAFRGPDSRFALGASCSRSSASLPASESKVIGITGLAAMIALAGGCGAGFGVGLALTAGALAEAATLVGFAAEAAFAVALDVDLTARERAVETDLLRAADFFAAAAFLAGSFFAPVFLAFVAFADGFFAAIESASAPGRNRLFGQVITHEGRDYTDGAPLVQPGGNPPHKRQKRSDFSVMARVSRGFRSHTLARALEPARARSRDERCSGTE